MRTAPRKPTDLIANASPWSCMHVDASIGVGPMSGRHRPTWRQRAAFRWLLEFEKNVKSTLKPDSFQNKNIDDDVHGPPLTVRCILYISQAGFPGEVV